MPLGVLKKCMISLQYAAEVSYAYIVYDINAFIVYVRIPLHVKAKSM